MLGLLASMCQVIRFRRSDRVVPDNPYVVPDNPYIILGNSLDDLKSRLQDTQQLDATMLGEVLNSMRSNDCFKQEPCQKIINNLDGALKQIDDKKKDANLNLIRSSMTKLITSCQKAPSLEGGSNFVKDDTGVFNTFLTTALVRFSFGEPYSDFELGLFARNIESGVYDDMLLKQSYDSENVYLLNSPLRLAINSMDVRLVELVVTRLQTKGKLLEALKQKDITNNNPLHTAFATSDPEIIICLLNAMDISLKDKEQGFQESDLFSEPNNAGCSVRDIYEVITLTKKGKEGKKVLFAKYAKEAKVAEKAYSLKWPGKEKWFDKSGQKIEDCDDCEERFRAFLEACGNTESLSYCYLGNDKWETPCGEFCGTDGNNYDRNKVFQHYKKETIKALKEGLDRFSYLLKD